MKKLRFPEKVPWKSCVFPKKSLEKNAFLAKSRLKKMRVSAAADCLRHNGGPLRFVQSSVAEIWLKNGLYVRGYFGTIDW